MRSAEDYPRGPNGLAMICEDKIAELLAEREKLPRSQRRPINQRLHQVRTLLRFAKTRAGYVATEDTPSMSGTRANNSDS